MIPTTMTLPADHLACLVCGVAVASPPEAERVALSVWGRADTPFLPHVKANAPPSEVMMTRCAACIGVHERARAVLASHPRVEWAIGTVALHQLECALDALDALAAQPGRMLSGRVEALTESDAAVRALLTALTTPGAMARWAARFAPVTLRDAAPDSAATSRWAHLSDGHVKALRDGYAALLRARIQVPGPVRPPDGAGCLLCGIGSVQVVPSRAHEAWTWRRVRPSVLGGKAGPEPVDGYLCPACVRAVVAVGSIGPTAMERALLAHLGVGQRSLSATELVGLVAWCAVTPRPSEPNARPWEHVAGLAALADELRTAG
jgi:hypothetical protein